MRYDLRAMMRRAGVNRRRVVIRPIRVRPAQTASLGAIMDDPVDRWNRARIRLLEVYARAHRDGTATDSAIAAIYDNAADVDELERLIALVAIEIENAMVRIRSRVAAWAEATERWHRQTWAEGVFAATSVRVDTILSPHDVGETVRAVVARNTELIRDISNQTRGRISDIVLRGVQTRTPPRDVAAAITEAVGMGTNRARNVARDQAVKLASALDRARHEEAGIEHFTWKHSGKAHPRKDHVARNGVIYKYKEGPGPGRNPPGDLPGDLPYCGCVAQATLLDDDGNAL